jgi:diguanylate cyclase (GGDEF)-like protein
MKFTAARKIFFLISWVALVLVGFFLAFHFFPPHSLNIWAVLPFFALAGAVSFFPIIINETPIFLVAWITLAGFLTYGLFFDLLLIQFSIIVLSLSLRRRKDELFRYFVNSLIFLIVSVFSGLAYYLAGGHTGQISLAGNLFPLFVYQFVYFILNAAMLQTVSRILHVKKRLVGSDTLWDLFTVLLVIPLSLSLYFLNQSIGVFSFMLIGIPFVSFSLILRLYNSAERINEYLQKAAEIGHQLTEKWQVDEVLDFFIQKISQTLTVEYACILDVINDELVLLRGVEHGQQRRGHLIPQRKNEGIAGRVWGAGKAVLYSEKSEWKDDIEGYVPENLESILCVPIFKSQQVEGVLFLGSGRKNAYEKYQMAVLDILCSYFVVALSNARHHEKTKSISEHCSLTKLYNYRFFENLLTAEFEKLAKKTRQGLSLIMLDIDDFKKINDTYGHQSGNEILVKMAARIKRLIGSQGTVARYGGEEFVVLLPDTEKSAALQLAETIRGTIANRSFNIHDSLDEDYKQIQVNVTVSIGVAAAPNDAEDALSLIRHADRALYIGAKRAGKNLVAKYVKA